jgi:transcriptional regulator with XRE-family HTH domain
MPARERIQVIGARRGARLADELARMGWEARLSLGLSRAAIAAAMHVSASKLARWEHARHPLPDVREAARWMRTVGLDLTLACYPAAGPLRDVAHTRLISRLLAILPAGLPHWLEAPMPIAHDQRAWDVLIAIGGARVGVVAETRMRDWQALLRREQAKARDSQVDHLLLVLASTRANRRAVHDAGAALRTVLPLDGRTVRAALRGRRDPGAGGLLFI